MEGWIFPLDILQKKMVWVLQCYLQNAWIESYFLPLPTTFCSGGLVQKILPDFKFLAKAPRTITHLKKFIKCEQMLADFYGVTDVRLKEKEACILFQLPPRIAYSKAKLKLIINSLKPSMKNVLEFRHESWWSPIVFNKLAKHNNTFCRQSHPQFPGWYCSK